MNTTALQTAQPSGWLRILVGDGDSILCTKQFACSDSVSLMLARGRHGRLPPLLWRPPVVTREVGVVERAFLKWTDVFRVMA